MRNTQAKRIRRLIKRQNTPVMNAVSRLSANKIVGYNTDDTPIIQPRYTTEYPAGSARSVYQMTKRYLSLFIQSRVLIPVRP